METLCWDLFGNKAKLEDYQQFFDIFEFRLTDSMIDHTAYSILIEYGGYASFNFKKWLKNQIPSMHKKFEKNPHAGLRIGNIYMRMLAG